MDEIGQGAILYGREPLLQIIQDSTKAVTVLAGDPGAGKSALLAAAGDSGRGIVAPPVATRHAENALVRAYAQSLIEASVLVAEQRRAFDEVGMAIGDALVRLQRAGKTLSVDTLKAIVWGVVEQKVGSDAAHAIRHSVEVAIGREPSFQQRVLGVLPPDVVDDLSGLASELLTLAGVPITLRIDRLDAIAEPEFRKLLDLTEAMPAGLKLLGCWSLALPEAVQRVDDLRRAGAEVIDVPPLPEPEVTAWLQAAGLDGAALLTRVMQVTAGNALWVDAAIRHLLDGRSLDELSANDQVKAINRSAYAALAPGDQSVVDRLAAFNDPLSAEQAPAYLQVDPPEWANVEARLIRARILGAVVGGRPWFHELRRRHLWVEVFTDHQRSESASSALEFLAASTQATGADPTTTDAAARLAPYAHRLTSSDPELKFAVECRQDALALAGAVLELSEPTGPGGSLDAVNGGALVRHAREAFGVDGDLVPALRAMADARLVVLVEDQHAAACIRIWRSWPATLVFVGRIARELGRYPLQYAASTVFETFLRPRLGAFHRGATGVGSIGVTGLLQMRRQEMPDINAEGYRLMRMDAPAVVVQAMAGELPIYAVTAYMEEEAARSAPITVGSVPSAGGPPVEIAHVLRFPISAIASRRFLRAAERIVGVSLGNTFGGTVSGPAPPSPSLDDRVSAQAQVLEVVRGLCDLYEAAALDVLRPLGYIYGTDDAGSIVAEVHNLDGSRRVALAREPWGPFSSFQLAVAAGLAPNQSIGAVSIRSIETDDGDGPLRLLADVHRRAAEFNKFQSRVAIPWDAEHIQQLCQAAELRTRSDAAALAGAFSSCGYDVPVELGRSTYVLLWRDDGKGIAFNEHLSALSIWIGSATGSPVKVKLLDHPPSVGNYDHADIQKLLKGHFGLETDKDTVFHTSNGFARPALAELLGHLESELDLPDRGEALRWRANPE